MATYCYTNTDGETIDKFYPMGKAPAKVKVKGRTYTRDIVAEHAGCPNTGAANWPMYSDFAGCHPDQIPEAQAVLRKAGTRADYLPDGRIKFESARHRATCLKALGYYDRN